MTARASRSRGLLVPCSLLLCVALSASGCGETAHPASGLPPDGGVQDAGSGGPDGGLGTPDGGTPDGGVGNPIVLPPGAEVVRDVAYGPDPMQRFDVYRPIDADNAPVIFMVHGGGWVRGDKSAQGVVQNKIDHWLPKGYVFISTNYRFVPQITAPEEADDVAAALAFAQSHAATWGADPTRFVVMGHSAGANLVALLAADPSIAADAGAEPWLGTIPLDSAAYNVVQIMEAPHLSLYDRAFGTDMQVWRDASPILRLSGKPAPMLLVCSSQRAESCGQADAFATGASALDATVTVLPVDLDHGEIDSQLGVPGKYTDDVEAFMQTLGLP
ncbi:MAG: alpha/beta hydrolase [Myxococcales bacterium]|nr:alpha/beta hydrolase [Myxococcales bacterium]